MDKNFAMASVLLDEGYSESYERCLKATRVCSGDIEKARDLLSKITIAENQFY
jgi:exonuclease VII small subunit